MLAQDAFIQTIQLAAWVSEQLLSDLSDADLLIRPVPGMNPVAWQLGHLVLSMHEKMTALGHPMPALPAGFALVHTRARGDAEAPHERDDPAGAAYATKAEYLGLLATMRDATIAAIRATPEADLDLPAPASLRRYTPTIGAVFNLIGAHEFMHHGQIVALRRRLGKPVLI